MEKRDSMKVLVDRLSDIEAESRRINMRLAELASEAEEIKQAVKVLQRYGVSLEPAPADEAQPSVTTERKSGLTDAILSIAAKYELFDGVTSAEAIRELHKFEGINADPNNVRPTLWRLVKSGKLVKNGDRYGIPQKDEASTDTSDEASKPGL